MEYTFDSNCLHAFRTLKQSLISAPIMQPPDWNLPFEIMYDASDYAVGAVLGQRKVGKVNAIYYASKTVVVPPKLIRLKCANHHRNGNQD